MTDCTSFQETSFSLYQQLVAPGGLRLRGGERETGRKVHMINLSKNLNVKVYNSYPKCFDFSIKSIARRNTFNTIFGLNLEICPFTKLWENLSSINTITFHIRSELEHITCWERMAHLSEISPKHFDPSNVWIWINLMRWRYDACAHWPGLSVRTRTRFKFPMMQSISVLSFATQITA